MSIEYDEYLNEHVSNVCAAYEWLRVNLPDVARIERDLNSTFLFLSHDSSKYCREEYIAYDEYFYGDMTSSENSLEQVKEDFNYAWLHHIHNNPHHWQYWVLINDDAKEGTIVLDIPYRYVIEMICDWWSFSFKTGNLYEIFGWYNTHKDRMILSDHTRELVEEILNKIRDKLDELNGKN